MALSHLTFIFFFFNDTATTEIYTLSLHDALPILAVVDVSAQLLHHLERECEACGRAADVSGVDLHLDRQQDFRRDRKSTRLNSSHGYISYAVFCLKKKKIRLTQQLYTAVRVPRSR